MIFVDLPGITPCVPQNLLPDAAPLPMPNPATTAKCPITVGSEAANDNPPRADDVLVDRPDPAELELILDLADFEFGGVLVERDTIRRMYWFNENCVWGIYGKNEFGLRRPLGGFAFLYLNEAGEAAVRAGTFDARDPDVGLLVKEDVEPAAIHIWGAVARKMAYETGTMIAKALGPWFFKVNLSGHIGTIGGAKAMKRLGFKNLSRNEGEWQIGDLLFYDRAEAAAQAKVKEKVEPKVTVKVVHTQEEFTQALGIRFAAYCAEQNCPWGEDVEGNDFSSTHVIAYVDGEPAATLRLRWFSSFVHMGRVGAVKRFRGGNAVPELIRYSFELCRRKGYTKAYGQAERALEGYWLMLGCKVINRGQPIVWSDHEYVEVTLDLDPHPEAITLASDPMTILRREGEWDVPGAIEASSMRGLQKVGFEDKGRDAA